MLDPISLLATATAVFNGLKKAVELGREAEDVFGQLGKWAGAVSDLQEWMSGQENTKPPLFKKLVFSKSATVEAFDAYAAQVKIKEMMFIMGFRPKFFWLGCLFSALVFALPMTVLTIVVGAFTFWRTVTDCPTSATASSSATVTPCYTYFAGFPNNLSPRTKYEVRASWNYYLLDNSGKKNGKGL